MIYITWWSLLGDSEGEENTVDAGEVVGEDPPLTESPEALVLELLHEGLEAVLVLGLGVQVTLPGHQHHQTSCKTDG